jgi:hypothetical protein
MYRRSLLKANIALLAVMGLNEFSLAGSQPHRSSMKFML